MIRAYLFLILSAAALAAAPAAAGPMTVKNCSDQIVTVELRDAQDGPVVSAGQIAGTGASWSGACNAAQCHVRVSATIGSGSVTAADRACAVGLRSGGTGPTYGIFAVPGALCPC